MVKRKTKFSTKGIKRALGRVHFNKSSYYKSIVEYIWNGFDAGASKIEIDFTVAQGDYEGYFKKLKIRDDGKGINSNTLSRTFEPIYDSEKLLADNFQKNRSTLHGRNGIGRLTFFTFCDELNYETVYQLEDKRHLINLKIEADSLDAYTPSDKVVTENAVGTSVEFSRFRTLKAKNIEKTLIDYLKKEFCWLIELNEKNNFKILVNGEELDYSDLISEKNNCEIEYKDNEKLEIRYVKWNSQLNKEYSKFYFMKSSDEEVWKETTKLNNQGDEFYHSVYLKSKYFDDFNFKTQEDSDQKSLTGGVRADKKFKYFQEKTYKFLKKQRKPFLKEHSEKVFQDLKSEGVISKVEKNSFEEVELNDFERVFKEIYQVQPKFFTHLTKEQKKIIIDLMRNLLKTGDRYALLDIIDGVNKLTEDERRDLSEILKVTDFHNIVSTLSLIKRRYKVVELLKKLVFDDKEYKTNERDNLQKIIQDNYWLFGEEYHLTTADESFQKSLEKYVYLIDGIKDKDIIADKEYSKKRFDIFMCRRRPIGRDRENVIVELKAPSVKLGRKEYNQICMYKEALEGDSRFKISSSRWKIILVSCDFDKKNFTQSQINTNKGHGENGLIMNDNGFKMYAKTWAEVFEEFELNYQHLDSKLNLQKDKLVEEFKDANQGTKIILNNK